MLRTFVFSVAVILLLAFSSAATAAGEKDKKPDKVDRPRMLAGTVVKVDAATHTITVKVRGKDGKEQERTIEIKEGVKLIGEDGKEGKEAEFLRDLKTGEFLLISEKDGKVVQLRDFPTPPRYTPGTVVKTDVANHTITIKARGKDGKDEEKTIELKAGVKLIGEDGKEDKEAEFFKDLKAGEQILVMERDGKVVEVRDLPERANSSFATVVRTDADKQTLTVKARGKDRKEEEKTIEIKGVKLIGKDGKDGKLADFAAGDNVVLVEMESKLISVREMPAVPRYIFGTVVKVDTPKHSITLKVRGRDGKEEEKTIEIKGVKLIGKDGKDAKLADFAAGDNVVLVEMESKLISVREMPAVPRYIFGTVVKVDVPKHSITLKVKGRDGKEEEKTIEIKEGVKLIGEDGKEDKEAHFLKELQPGEQILVQEREGRIVEIRDLPQRTPRPDDTKDKKKD